jgi:hypothetical protein
MVSLFQYIVAILYIIILSISGIAFEVGEDVCLSKNDITLSYFNFTFSLKNFVAYPLI